MGADWAMVIVTSIYVLATIAILISNQKAVEEARNQVAASKSMQKATVKMQMFDKRYEVYKILGNLYFYGELLGESKNEIELLDDIEIYLIYRYDNPEAFKYKNSSKTISGRTPEYYDLKLKAKADIFCKAEKIQQAQFCFKLSDEQIDIINHFAEAVCELIMSAEMEKEYALAGMSEGHGINNVREAKRKLDECGAIKSMEEQISFIESSEL